ncbi:MAG: hypothetical protein ACSHXZ_13285 [Gammaproteobacteria bacterium]
MINFFLTIAGLFIGVIATILVSKHYYHRSVSKRLTPFVQMQSNVFPRIDSSLRKRLRIEYEGSEVDNLQQVQFLVANTGEKAISAVIEMLKLQLPRDTEILDATIVHVSPPGRKVTLSIDSEKNTITFDFSILNQHEYFIFKLMLKGEPELEGMVFSIVAEDLPPTLSIERLTHDLVETESYSHNSSFETGPFLAGLAIFFVGSCIAGLAFYGSGENFPVIENASWMWLNSIPIFLIFRVVSYILSAILYLAAVMMIAGSLSGIRIVKKQKLRIPDDHAKFSFGISRRVESEKMATNKQLQRTPRSRRR